jgi:hypothetical protein
MPYRFAESDHTYDNSNVNITHSTGFGNTPELKLPDTFVMDLFPSSANNALVGPLARAH